MRAPTLARLRARHDRKGRCAGLLAALLAMTGFVASVAPGGTVAGAAGGAKVPAHVAAAEYFGGTNPYTLWSSTLSGAPATFRRMHKAGFNAVALVIPWTEFQPGLSPVRYDNTSFGRLQTLVADAADLHMGVVLRLSFDWDVAPGEQGGFAARFQTLWSKPSVLKDWLGFISRVHATVAHDTNVWAAYISWEDLWQPVSDAQATTTAAQRLTLAGTSGYRAWLKTTEPIATVSTQYGTTFADWTAVPTPTPDTPIFALMYKFQDWVLIHRLYDPAAKKFPGLTMETRVDVDPLRSGTTVVGGYAHTPQYVLPGTKTTGIYFSPYMGDPSTTKVETATEALTGLQATLTRMQSVSKGRKIFIYEYEFVSNSPAVADDPAITPGQVATFVSRSEPLLAQGTSGYALWVFQDYLVSPIFNPSFALGATGWTLTGGAKAEPSTSGRSFASLPAGGTATQDDLQAALVTATSPATASLEADASKPTTLSVSWGTSSQTVNVGPGWHSYQLTIAAPTEGSTDTFSVRASGPAQVSDLQIGWFTQEGDVYTVTGRPGPALAALGSLNASLTGSS